MARGKNAIFDIVVAMRVDVLVLDGVFDLGLSAVLDVFQTANELIGMAGLDVPRFEVRTVAMRRTVKTSLALVPIAGSAATMDASLTAWSVLPLLFRCFDHFELFAWYLTFRDTGCALLSGFMVVLDVLRLALQCSRC